MMTRSSERMALSSNWVNERLVDLGYGDNLCILYGEGEATLVDSRGKTLDREKGDGMTAQVILLVRFEKTMETFFCGGT